jgi:hypothetical protein
VAEMIVIANSKKWNRVINPLEYNEWKVWVGSFENIDLTIFAKIITGNIPLESM